MSGWININRLRAAYGNRGRRYYEVQRAHRVIRASRGRDPFNNPYIWPEYHQYRDTDDLQAARSIRRNFGLLWNRTERRNRTLQRMRNIRESRRREIQRRRDEAFLQTLRNRSRERHAERRLYRNLMHARSPYQRERMLNTLEHLNRW